MPTIFSYSFSEMTLDGTTVREDVVFPDDPRPQDLAAVREALEPGTGPLSRPGDRFFIPSKVGLPDLQSRISPSRGVNDTDWHRVDHAFMGRTTREPTTEMLFSELAERFRRVSWRAD